MTGFMGSTGVVMVLGASGPRGVTGMTGPSRPVGATGPIGPLGVTGPAGPPLREVFYPGKEERTVARSSYGDDVIELRARACSTVSWDISIRSSITMVLLRDGAESVLRGWGPGETFLKEPEDMATLASAYLVEKEVASPGPEELVAMFVMAKKAAMKMVAVVCAELLISHIGHDEMGEAWDDANALRVMSE